MNCIVNVDANWGIGKENQLLVAISADLKRFRALTTGKTVILGRKTLATFPGGRPLKNRVNLVMSTDQSLVIEGAEVVHHVPQLLERCKQLPAEDVCVIGGASVYELLLPYCNTAKITKTLKNFDADRFFPNLDKLPGWHIAWQSDIQEENGVRFQYVDYVNDAPISR